MAMNIYQRKIRSFVRREGRITAAQSKALVDLWPCYGLTTTLGELNLREIFLREADTILEIGFGHGDSLLEMAKANPDSNFIGIEVHRPGVGALLTAIHQCELTNVRIFQEDAIEVLENSIPDNSLQAIQLFFPDPWHKKRHNKRRILQDNFLNLIHSKLKADGVFHMATDWQDYADYALNLLNNRHDFRNFATDLKFTPRPASRPITKFEKRGIKLGHSIYDLMFKKV